MHVGVQFVSKHLHGYVTVFVQLLFDGILTIYSIELHGNWPRLTTTLNQIQFTCDSQTLLTFRFMLFATFQCFWQWETKVVNYFQ